jgi:hypothetical protein
MKTLRAVLMVVLAYSFLQVLVPAQQEKPAAPTGIALEVTYYKGTRPSYQVVPNNAWYARFRTIEGWQAAEGSLPVQAVNVAARMEGAAVRVIVSVHLGKKLFEKQDTVGSYLLQENERLTVYEMNAFGLEPFEIAVVRVEPESAAAPTVTSNVRSVNVADVQAIGGTLPTFRITLRNSSKKNVSALFVEMFVDGRLRISAMPHNRGGEPLILAGETYELKRQLSTDAKRSGGGYAPEPSPNQTIVIKTAVFDDGTYEGEAASAAKFRSYALGRRQQYAQLLALYQQALKSTESDPSALIITLRAQIDALGTEANQLDVDKLAGYFSGAIDRASVKDDVEVVMFELKKEALKEVDDFRRKQAPVNDREALRAWLIYNQDKYQKLHDLLKGL